MWLSEAGATLSRWDVTYSHISLTLQYEGWGDIGTVAQTGVGKPDHPTFCKMMDSV